MATFMQQRIRKKKMKHKKSILATSHACNTIPAPMEMRRDHHVCDQLIEAARFGNTSRVCEILKRLRYCPTEFESISQAFLCGAQFGSTQICQLILNKISRSLHQRIVDPAFILSAKNGHIQVCKYLLSKGAHIESRGIHGETALLIAADNNHDKMVKFLLHKANADILCCDNYGNSILHIACKRGYPQIAKIVLNYKNKRKSFALPYAVNCNKETPIQVSKTQSLIRMILMNVIETQSTSHCSYFHKTKKCKITSPFKPLPVDNPEHIPTSHLFWRTIGCGKDRCIFQSFHVYPFDRLQDSERIVVLTRVAEAMSGYKTDLKCNILNESTLYVVFAMMKRHIMEEINGNLNNAERLNSDDIEDKYDAMDTADHTECCGGGDVNDDVVIINDASPTPTPPPSESELDAIEDSAGEKATNYTWRIRTMNAFEQLFKIDGFLCGLKVECEEMEVWNTVIDLIAYTIFGESFWNKKQMFCTGDTFNRRQYLLNADKSYWNSTLPSSEQLTSEQIQVMYRKLVTMSKSLLRKNPHQHIKSNENASLCFCPDCIADRQVPLRFKLQFLEEQAEEKQKKQYKKYMRNQTLKGRNTLNYNANSQVIREKELAELKLSNKSQLTQFWNDLDLKQKRSLTSMLSSELKDILSASPQWETLRASLNSYTTHPYETDMLFIKNNDKDNKEQVITLSDYVIENKEMKHFLNKLFAKILKYNHHKEKEKENKKKATNHKPYAIDINALNQYSINGDFDRIKLLNIAYDDECIYDAAVNDATDDLTSQLISISCNDITSLIERMNIREDIWERYGRKMLEQVVLCEFAKKIAYQYSKETKISESDAAFKDIIKTLKNNNNIMQNAQNNGNKKETKMKQKKKLKKDKKNRKKKQNKQKKKEREREREKKNKDKDDQKIESLKTNLVKKKNTNKAKSNKTKQKKKKKQLQEIDRDKDNHNKDTKEKEKEKESINKFVTDEVLSESKSLYASSACSYSNSKPSETISEDSKEQEICYEHDDDLAPLAIWSETEENETPNTISPPSATTIKSILNLDDDRKIADYSSSEPIKKRNTFNKSYATKPPIISRPLFKSYSLNKAIETAVNQAPKRPSRPPQSAYNATANLLLNDVYGATCHPNTNTNKSNKSHKNHNLSSSNSNSNKTPNKNNNDNSSNNQKSESSNGGHKDKGNKKESSANDVDPWEIISNFKDGMMFICSNETYSECMEIKLLGLPKQYLRLVKELNPDRSALFLFNMTERMLHGVFKATDKGSENINPIAWSRNKHSARFSPFPAQIPFRVVYEFKPLPESSFRHMFHDGNRIRKLDESETKEILTLYRNSLKPKLQTKFKINSEKHKKRTQTALTGTTLITSGAPQQNVWTLRAKQKKQKKSSSSPATKAAAEKEKDTKKRVKPPQLSQHKQPRLSNVHKKASTTNKNVRRLPTKPPIISILNNNNNNNNNTHKAKANHLAAQAQEAQPPQAPTIRITHLPPNATKMIHEYVSPKPMDNNPDSMTMEAMSFATDTSHDIERMEDEERNLHKHTLIDSLYANEAHAHDLTQTQEIIRSVWDKQDEAAMSRMSRLGMAINDDMDDMVAHSNEYNTLSLSVEDNDPVVPNNNNIVTVLTNTAATNPNNQSLWSTNDTLGWSPRGSSSDKQILPPTPPPPSNRLRMHEEDLPNLYHPYSPLWNDGDDDDDVQDDNNNNNNLDVFKVPVSQSNGEPFASVFKFAQTTELNPKAKEWSQASPSSSATSNPSNGGAAIDKNKLLTIDNSSPFGMNEIPNIPSPLSVDRNSNNLMMNKSIQQNVHNAAQQQQQQQQQQQHNQYLMQYNQRYGGDYSSSNNMSPQTQSTRYTQQQHQNYNQRRQQYQQQYYNQYAQYTQYQQQQQQQQQLRYQQQQQQQQQNGVSGQLSSVSSMSSGHSQQQQTQNMNNQYQYIPAARRNHSNSQQQQTQSASQQNNQYQIYYNHQQQQQQQQQQHQTQNNIVEVVDGIQQTQNRYRQHPHYKMAANHSWYMQNMRDLNNTNTAANNHNNDKYSPRQWR